MKSLFLLTALALMAPSLADAKTPKRPAKNTVYLGSGRCAYKCDSTYDNRVYIYRTSYCPSWPFEEEFSSGITIYCSQRAN